MKEYNKGNREGESTCEKIYASYTILKEYYTIY